MSDLHLTPEQVQRLAATVKGGGIDPAAMNRALTEDDWSGLTAVLSAEDTAKVRAVWQDKEKLAALLDNPAVKQLLAQLGGRHG